MVTTTAIHFYERLVRLATANGRKSRRQIATFRKLSATLPAACLPTVLMGIELAAKGGRITTGANRPHGRDDCLLRQLPPEPTHAVHAGVGGPLSGDTERSCGDKTGHSSTVLHKHSCDNGERESERASEWREGEGEALLAPLSAREIPVLI